MKHERYRYRITWREGTKPQQKYFKTKEESIAKAREIEKRLAAEGASQDPMTQGERQGVLRWRELSHRHDIPADVTLQSVVEDYLTRWITRNESASLQKVVDGYIAHREAEKKSQRHLDDLRFRLDRMLAHFRPEITLAEIKSADVSAWLQGMPLSQQSRLNYRRVASAVFNFAVQQQLIERNPVAFAIKPRVPEADPGILISDQMSQVLNALLQAKKFDLLAAAAIGAFVGMRTSERLALRWEKVHLIDAEPFAQVTGKTGKRNAPLPPNAVAWLSLCWRQSGMVIPMTNDAFNGQMRTFRQKHGFEPWPHNALRHSYASYRLAQCNQPALVAGELGNSVSVLRRRYARLVTPAEAEAWFAIMPPKQARNVIAITASAGE